MRALPIDGAEVSIDGHTLEPMVDDVLFDTFPPDDPQGMQVRAFVFGEPVTMKPENVSVVGPVLICWPLRMAMELKPGALQKVRELLAKQEPVTIQVPPMQISGPAREVAVPETKNTAWGFWGQWGRLRQDNPDVPKVDEAWAAAFSVVRDKSPGMADDLIRQCLDQPGGRHYANQVVDAMLRGGKTLREALAEGTLS